MLSMSSDVNDPGARQVTFDQVYAAYREQAQALHEGGVDLFLIETIIDTLNAKAAIKAILDLEDEGLEPLPIWISGTITDRSGRTLSGQTVEAFWNSIRHARPFAVGFNCALGADLMRPHIAELARIADTLVAAYPNAGLPNAFGEYDETPERDRLHAWANGRRAASSTSSAAAAARRPTHIRQIARAVEGRPPRQIPERAAGHAALGPGSVRTRVTDARCLNLLPLWGRGTRSPPPLGEGDRPRVRPKAGPRINSAVEGVALRAGRRGLAPLPAFSRAPPIGGREGS